MKVIRVLIILSLLINGIGAVAAGIMFIIVPGGELLGMNTDLLQHSPFKTFFIPGLILFLFNGVFSLYTLVQLIRRTKNYRLLVLTQGLILFTWLFVQVIMIRQFHFMQLFMAIISAHLIVSYFILRPTQKHPSYPGSQYS